MSRESESSNHNSSGMRHEVITSLQILTLMAELLAIDLRDSQKTPELVQQRSEELWNARKRVSDVARRLPARLTTGEPGAGESFASTLPIQEIDAFIGMITAHVALPDIDRDVLAEYVDHLHDSSTRLIDSIDGLTD